MPEFKNLIQIERADNHTPGLNKRGCDFCPLDTKKGLHKIMGKVRGRKIFLWAQSPGPKENKERKELIGPSGEFLWYELKKQAGITRDMVDIQNVVRCMPADHRENVYPSLVMRAPSKEEIKCCSIYNERALELSKAKLHLVFGKIAAQAVLGKEFKANKRIFYSEKMKAWVVYLDHPAYFIRQGYRAGDNRPASASLKRLRNDLRHVKTLLHNKSSDRFAFIKSLDSRGIVTRKQAWEAYRKLKHDGLHGHRLVFDMEEGRVDKHGKPDDNGKSIALVCGIQSKLDGAAYVFALDAPNCPASTRCRNLNHKLVKKLLTNPRIKKAAHYAASDYNAVEKLMHYRVHGLDYDTLLGDFFRDPNAKAYGLAVIADRSYPDFAGYKDIRHPEAMTEAYAKFMEKKKLAPGLKIEMAEKKNKLNLARLPWKKMVWYNGADCHIEKIIEQDTLKHVNQPLMEVYVDSGHVLYRMQTERKCQPTFDFKWHDRIAAFYNAQMKLVKKEIRRLVGKHIKIRTKWQSANPGKKVRRLFNPNSRDQLKWYLVKKLKILDKDGNTKASTLKGLSRKYPKIKEPGLFLAHSSLKKRISTYIVSYRNCAELNEGHLRTNWKQTGTGTGRLSSGKTKERSDDNVVNLQNVDGEPFVQCLIVSDPRWWKLYRYWLEHGDFDKHTWKMFEDLDVMLGYDFSQNELRQLAEESGDKELQRIFASKKLWKCDTCGKMHKPDPHVEVGHALTGWKKGVIAHNDRFRKLVKNMQFGLVYGLQGEGLYRFLVMLGVKTTLEEVNKYHKRYFKKFRGVERLQNYYRGMAKRDSAVTNVFGFRRGLNVQEQDEADPDEERKGGWWGNQSINTPIQGASHQLLLMSIAALHRKKKKYKILQYPVMEVHDAIYNRVKLQYLMRGVDLGKDLMMKEPVEIVKNDFGRKKKVPLSAEPKAGFRFGVQVKLGEDIKTEWDFLNAWCKENKQLHDAYRWCKAHNKPAFDDYIDYLEKKKAKANKE